MARNRDLRPYELSEHDWSAIQLVTSWLKAFRSATTQMSMSKHPTLSFTHAIFHGLQESVKNALRDLPREAHGRLKIAIVAAHRKLSDYYYHYNQSHLYVWASSEWLLDIHFMFDAFY